MPCLLMGQVNQGLVFDHPSCELYILTIRSIDKQLLNKNLLNALNT